MACRTRRSCSAGLFFWVMPRYRMLNAGRTSTLKPSAFSAVPVGRVRQVVAVDRAGLQFLLAGGLVRDDLEDQRLGLGLLAPVVVVADQGDGVVGLVVGLELERSGAGRVRRWRRPGRRRSHPRPSTLFGVVLLQRGRRLHGERRQAEDGRELRGDAGQLDDRRAPRRRPCRRRRRSAPASPVVVLLALEAAHVVRPVLRLGGAGAGLVVHPVQVEADGRGVERGAVVELHALLQLERPGQAVAGLLPGLRPARARRRRCPA